MKISKFAGAFAALAMLAACGGDDAGNPPPNNQPPDFGQGSVELTVAENTGGTIYTVVVTDEDLPGVLITLGGGDANDFTLDGDGNISFVAPPDFENPTDANGDNVYEFVVTAVDAIGNSSRLDVTVTVTDTVGTTRFLDPVFDGTTTLGSVTLPAASGHLAISLGGPLGDTMAMRPLVVVGAPAGMSAQADAIAADLAARGYVTATIGSAAPADLQAVATAFGQGAYQSLGIESRAIAVAGLGDADYGSALQASFAGSGMPTFAFEANARASDTGRSAAATFYNSLIGGRP